MAKNYKRFAERHTKQKRPDLYPAIRQFAAQQDQIIAAAKEQNLRIQQNQERFADQKDKSKAKSLQNLQELQNLKNRKYETRSKAIKVRRDTEVDRLEGEARQYQEKADFLESFVPKAAKAFTNLALATHERLDYEQDKKVFNHLVETGQLQFLEKTQALKNQKGLENAEETKNKAEAIEKNDRESLAYLTYRGRQVRNNRFLLTYYKDNREALFASFAEKVSSTENFEFNKDNIYDYFLTRGREIAQQMGFDPLSEEGLHIINDWVSRGNQARADFAEYQAAGEREAGWKKDLRLFKDNPTQLNLNNLIQNYHTINFEWNSSSNKFVIKSNDLKTDIKQIGLKAFKEVASFDKYHTIGQAEGYELYRRDTIKQLIPESKGTKIESWESKHKFIEEEIKQFYIDAHKKWSADLVKTQKDNDTNLTALIIERTNNSDHPNYIDISTVSGIEELASLYKQAGPESQKQITKLINYDIDDSTYSLDKHVEILKASKYDPSGFIHLIKTLTPKERLRYELEGKVAEIMEANNYSWDGMRKHFKGVVSRYVLQGKELTIGKDLDSSTDLQIDQINQEFVYNLQHQIKRLDTDEFSNDINDYYITIRRETEEGIKDTNRNPIISVGDVDGYPGQEALLFREHYKGLDPDKPKELKEWMSHLEYGYAEGYGYLNPDSYLPVNGDSVLDDIISKGELLTNKQTLHLVKELEEGGGGDNVIILPETIAQFIKASGSSISAEEAVNQHLEVKGFKHRLPPSRETLIKWSGYRGNQMETIDQLVIDAVNFLQQNGGVLYDGGEVLTDPSLTAYLKPGYDPNSNDYQPDQALVTYNTSTGMYESLIS